MDFDFEILQVIEKVAKDAAELAVKQYRIEKREEPEFISRYAAWNWKGRYKVERWIKEGLVKLRQDGPGANYKISVMELEIADRSSNRHTYMTAKELKEAKLLDKALPQNKITKL